MGTTLDVSIISVDGDPPPARGGHSAVTVENQIIILVVQATYQEASSRIIMTRACLTQEIACGMKCTVLVKHQRRVMDTRQS